MACAVVVLVAIEAVCGRGGQTGLVAAALLVLATFVVVVVVLCSWCSFT